MTFYLRNFFLLLLFGFTFSFQAKAQTEPILLGDKHYRAIEHLSAPPLRARMDGPDTLRITASQPFFEDFSSERKIPNPEKWFNPEISGRSIPLVTNNSAINPPSRGVLSFDGLDDGGLPYDTKALSFGKADLLLSQYLDLRGYNSSNNIYLTFYLQSGGRSEAPETTDSFLVSFLTPTDTFLVYSQAGGSSDFNRISIPINKAAWFIAEFQIAFENKGSLNGALDVWHLDYIELGLNRSPSNPAPNDQSAVRLVNSPIAPYSSIPLRHFPHAGARMQAFTAEISNLAISSKSHDIEATLSETFLNTPLSPPFNQVSSENLAAGANSLVDFSPFAEQSLAAISVLEVEVGISNSGDAHPENDSFRKKIPVDSVMGYDDGEADMSFGLNRPFGFGIKVTLDEPDSLSAVWISFLPTLNFNPVSNAIDYMEGKSFRFRVWSFPHPDSIFFEQVNDMRVNYGSEANEYVRFPLNRNVPVSGTFWVGIQQLNTLPLGVGYDMSFNNDEHCYYDSSGVWKNLELGGSLMIRPEFYNTNSILLDVQDDLAANISTYPNPLSDKHLTVSIENLPQMRRYRAIMFDQQGKKVFEMNRQILGSKTIHIELPIGLKQGLYVWQHILEDSSGENHVLVEKLLKN